MMNSGFKKISICTRKREHPRGTSPCTSQIFFLRNRRVNTRLKMKQHAVDVNVLQLFDFLPFGSGVTETFVFNCQRSQGHKL
ncbi:hypothetical protein RB195_016250 [Necator americanus]|uniref:ZP domain-containing protein n=1 Tax=Necator americanus TaxID=51031 RepID=A0ABR1E886_NECAM